LVPEENNLRAKPSLIRNQFEVLLGPKKAKNVPELISQPKNNENQWNPGSTLVGF